jgi:NAD(P)-dependent dehydrogenase (short-subunit alcohol dehydrogenase family)
VLALKGGPHNIRANVVAPGVVETDMLDNIRTDSREYLRSFADAHPLGRATRGDRRGDRVSGRTPVQLHHRRHRRRRRRLHRRLIHRTTKMRNEA